MVTNYGEAKIMATQEIKLSISEENKVNQLGREIISEYKPLFDKLAKT
jgi:hypothetical protein